MTVTEPSGSSVASSVVATLNAPRAVRADGHVRVPVFTPKSPLCVTLTLSVIASAGDWFAEIVNVATPPSVMSPSAAMLIYCVGGGGLSTPLAQSSSACSVRAARSHRLLLNRS